MTSGDDLHRRIIEATQEAVIFADREGRIALWNGGAERVFGWPAAEAIGQSLDLIIPDQLRGRHWHGWNQVMETGVTRYASDLLAVPAMRKDGTRISIEFTVALLQDDAGAVTGVAAVVRDVTERWQRDKELRAKLAANEAKAPASPAT